MENWRGRERNIPLLSTRTASHRLYPCIELFWVRWWLLLAVVKFPSENFLISKQQKFKVLASPYRIRNRRGYRWSELPPSTTASLFFLSFSFYWHSSFNDQFLYFRIRCYYQLIQYVCCYRCCSCSASHEGWTLVAEASRCELPPQSHRRLISSTRERSQLF